MEGYRERPILEVEHLTMRFTSGSGRKKAVTKAVEDVSFSIKKGETFGLVGESGCGKTTTGRAIIRLYEPTGGKVTFDDRVISGKMDRKLRRYITDNIAMIFQDPIASLNPRMTVQEIIGEGLKLHGVTSEEERRQTVIQMLERVGLAAEHATRYPHEFSGGQRQRIGIARALAVKPRFIIADEPVSALDVSIQAQVINLLNALKEEFGLTILFIAHNLSVVKYFSDRIGVMYYGRLVELAPAEKLYRNPLHPYTRALLSAIPQPDPRQERRRQCLTYEPTESAEPLAHHEIEPEHFVYCTDPQRVEYESQIMTV